LWGDARTERERTKKDSMKTGVMPSARDSPVCRSKQNPIMIDSHAGAANLAATWRKFRQ
jgi:hypothetical protein